MRRSGDWKEKVVLITGASSGIGAATALACGAEGMRVVLAARRDDRLREVAAQVKAAGGDALPVPTDVTDRRQVDALVQAAEERFGRVDVLVANAGLGYPGPLASTPDEANVRTLEVNLLGVIRSVQAVLPGMLARREGHIVTISSVAAGLAMPGGVVYAATKAGVHRFTEGLRREVGRHGIRVTDILPGIIDTPMTARVTDFPKAPASAVARTVLRAIRRPCRAVVVPSWYRLLLALNRCYPALIDLSLAFRYREWE